MSEHLLNSKDLLHMPVRQSCLVQCFAFRDGCQALQHAVPADLQELLEVVFSVHGQLGATDHQRGQPCNRQGGLLQQRVAAESTAGAGGGQAQLEGLDQVRQRIASCGGVLLRQPAACRCGCQQGLSGAQM